MNIYGTDWANMRVQVRLDKGAIAPTRAHERDAGIDLYVPATNKPVEIEPNGSLVVDTGVHVSIDTAYVGMVFPRSGMNVKHGVVCGTGVIDTGFEGSILVRLYNHGFDDFTVNPGDRIAQLVIMPIALPDLMLPQCETKEPRGENGYGSTGK